MIRFHYVQQIEALRVNDVDVAMTDDRSSLDQLNEWRRDM